MSLSAMNFTGDAKVLKAVPAHLSLLAIYNPTLGTTDETFQDQIVFYHSHAIHRKKRKDLPLEQQDVPNERDLQKEEDEKLRQVGLAQGMVNFAKTFSNGKPLDHIDTEKTRIVTRELEDNWWILAAVNLTKLPTALPSQQQKSTGDGKSESGPKTEYSSREVTPPALLMEQLQQAHSVFLLHTGSSLTQLFTRLGRTKFCAMLDRFWAKFAMTWDVMLHGSPAVDIFGGMKLAAGGELGMGVGEEQWGSGEREVLEDFVRRTDGLVDMVVCRFGSPPSTVPEQDKESSAKSKKEQQPPEPWMGVGRIPQASDGVVFSGMGMISRSSLRDTSLWLSTLYSQGDAAFGVRDSPTSDRKKRKKPRTEKPAQIPVSKDNSLRPGIPRPIIQSAEQSLEQATANIDNKERPASKPRAIRAKSSSKHATLDTATSPPSTWTKYLTLGYGTAWTLPDFDYSDMFTANVTPEELRTPLAEDALISRLKAHVAQENGGYFLIGLRGDPEDETDEVLADQQFSDSTQQESTGEWNRRIMLRTLHVHLSANASQLEPGSNTSSMALLSPALSTPGIDTDAASRAFAAYQKPQKEQKRRRFRILVYAHRPFVYLLLFNPTSPSLMIPPFYRHLHTFLAPLRDLLSKRTGGRVGSMRRRGFTSSTVSTPNEDMTSSKKEANIEKDVYEVLYDERTLAIVSSLPCIPPILPLLGSMGDEAEGLYPKRDADCPPGWTRAEALNVHSAALDILAANNASSTAGVEESLDEGAIERSVKTGRGWWVVWGRLGENATFHSGSASGPGSTKQTSGLTSAALETAESASGMKPVTSLHLRTNSVPDAEPDYFSPHRSSAAQSANTQIILVRRAQNIDSKGKARVSSGWSFGALGGAATEAGKMLDASKFGIGFDARRYMESIVRLGR